jgi:hypothetical protein
MGVTNNRSIHPEITLADHLLRYIPRTDKISKASLLTILYKSSKYYIEYRDYFEVALEILKTEKYLEIIDGTGDNTGIKEYRLTIEGRKLQAEGGYLKKYTERLAKEQFDKKVSTAEGKKKIFDNKVKYIVFSIVVLTAIFGLWPKLSSNKKKPETKAQNGLKDDSITVKPHDQLGVETTLTKPEKQQATNHLINIPEKLNAQGAISEVKKKEDNSPPVKSNSPIQVITSDKIEFKLLSVTGNSKTQSVTFMLILTTSAANWYISSNVRSIIDNEGNEYILKSFTNGASDYLHSIDLITGVPIKCTYTFGGVLPDVKTVKLFKYDYLHSAGERFAVEFRDIPVNWN